MGLSPLFSQAEYDDRLLRTRARMRDAEIDTLIVSDPANINYLTGFDATSFYVAQAVIVPPDGEPIWVGRGMDEGSAHLTTYLPSQNVIGYRDDLVESDNGHPMQAVAAPIRENGWGRRVAVEFDADYFTVQSFRVLEHELPQSELVDAKRLVNWVRAVKSESELEYMRQACRIAERAMTGAIDTIRPGVRECDVIAEILRLQTSGTDEYAGEAVAIAPWALPGSKATAPHSQWSGDRYSEDDCVFIGVGGCRARYHAALCRTIYLGRLTDDFERLAVAVQAGFDAALTEVKPGNTCEDVDAAWRDAMRSAGYEKEPRIGYPVGIAYPPSWNEKTMSFRPGDRTKLEPNMTFHLLAGMGYGKREPLFPSLPYDVTETVRVTEDGAEVLTRFSRELVVKT